MAISQPKQLISPYAKMFGGHISKADKAAKVDLRYFIDRCLLIILTVAQIVTYPEVVNVYRYHRAPCACLQ